MSNQLPKPRPGFKFIYQLPEGWDERTRLAAHPDGGVVAVHPDHAPIWVKPEERECTCDCHKDPPAGWNAEICCPDCGSSLIDDSICD